MASYIMNSKQDPTKILEQARDYFGPDGVGLNLATDQEDYLRFEGGGGYVLVQISDVESGSEVELETREWDYSVKKFMGKYA
jgi:hypothetical protein